MFRTLTTTMIGEQFLCSVRVATVNDFCQSRCEIRVKMRLNGLGIAG